MYGKLSKCEFYTPQLQYLGYIISGQGKVVDPKKIEVVKNWPNPTNVSEVQSFMGLAGYYKKFMKDFSKIANPITSLQKKNKKFSWDDKCTKAFEILKE